MAIGLWAGLILGLYITWRAIEVLTRLKEFPWHITARRVLMTGFDVGVVLIGSTPLFFVNLLLTLAWFFKTDAPDVAEFRRTSDRLTLQIGLFLACGLEVAFYAGFQALR
jgi:hypothetical protein